MDGITTVYMVLGAQGVTLGLGLALHRARRARRVFRRHVTEHDRALARSLAKAVKVNAYGAVTSDRRDAVLEEFCTSVGFDHTRLTPRAMHRIVADVLSKRAEADATDGFDPKAYPADAAAFEHWVARSLTLYGWQARASGETGDQGIDVVARQGGRSLGVQCKLYSGSVGNSAVQEAYAGAEFHGLDRAAVLSTGRFTRSAKALAEATNVLLLTPRDIPDLHLRAFA
ncbi:restriction endonuclease [Pseudaestuariivita sp.]|uniref:restriction endonuclease n=1 Tax=Pseudaestuariivita sp. TaxID=2211669 RepID=UPI004058CF91